MVWTLSSRTGRRTGKWQCFLSACSPNSLRHILVQHRKKQKGSAYEIMGLLSLAPVSIHSVPDLFCISPGSLLSKGHRCWSKVELSLPLLSPVDITFHYSDEPEPVLPVVLICPQASLCHVLKKSVTFSSLPHPSQLRNLE